MSNKLRVFEAFAGYGSQSIALRNIGIDFEVVGISEIDKYALIAYDAIHNKSENIAIKSKDEMLDELIKCNIGYDFKKNISILPKKESEIERLYVAHKRSKNLGDISMIDANDIPKHDLFTYSFPCQSVSVCGERKGLVKGSGTSSSLLWECQKVIQTKKPKYLLMENVKNLISKEFKPFFDEWLLWLEEQGYTNYWKVLNAKDYGIPQNRERVFVVSILNNVNQYEFPSKKEMADLQSIISDEEAKCTKPKVKEAFLNEWEDIISSNKDIYQCNVSSGFQDCKIGLKVSPTIRSNNPYTHIIDYSFPKPIKLEKTIHDLTEDDIDEKYQMSDVCIEKMKRFEPKNKDFDYNISPTITTELSHHTGKNLSPKLCKALGTYRRITPRECGRLMGLSDDIIDKIQNEKISDSQQYKMFGNSIVVQVIEEIFKNLFTEYTIK